MKSELIKKQTKETEKYSNAKIACYQNQALRTFTEKEFVHNL